MRRDPPYDGGVQRVSARELCSAANLPCLRLKPPRSLAMAIDPKAQAVRAQDAAAQAQAAAKAAAVAAAKAEAKAEAQAPPAVVQTAVAASTIAPLDVFAAATSAPAAQKSDTGQRELSSDQERMAEASGAGRSSARNPGKPGEVSDPDLASIGRPGGH